MNEETIKLIKNITLGLATVTGVAIGTAITVWSVNQIEEWADRKQWARYQKRQEKERREIEEYRAKIRGER